MTGLQLCHFCSSRNFPHGMLRAQFSSTLFWKISNKEKSKTSEYTSTTQHKRNPSVKYCQRQKSFLIHFHVKWDNSCLPSYHSCWYTALFWSQSSMAAGFKVLPYSPLKSPSGCGLHIFITWTSCLCFQKIPANSPAVLIHKSQGMPFHFDMTVPHELFFFSDHQIKETEEVIHK